VAFNSSTNKVATKGLVKVLETMVTGRLVIEDENIIDRTQGGVGRVSIISEDRVGDNIQISGSVNFSAIYTRGDKSISSGQIVLDFIERVDATGLENVVFVPTIKGYKTIKESDKSISVNVTIETRMYAVTSEEVGFLVGEEDGFYTATKQTKINRLVASSTANFSVSDTVNIAGGKIVAINSNVIANKVTPYDNYALVEGSAMVDILTSVEDQIKHIQKAIDFSEEVPVLNLTSGAILDFNLFDKGLGYSEETGEGTSGNVIVDISVGMAVWAFEQAEVELMTDVFSDKKDVDLTYSHFENVEIKPAKISSDRKTLVIDLEDKKRMDEILFVGQAISKLSEVKSNDGVVTIAGVTTVPVTYKNYDSDDTLSALLSGEFELSADLDFINDETFVDVSLNSRVNSFKNKAGKDISIIVDYDYVISSVVHSSEQYVSKIDEVGDKVNCSSMVIVYKPKNNESVFDIAKALQVSPDVIRLQNPQVEDGNPISQVVVYKKCN